VYVLVHDSGTADAAAPTVQRPLSGGPDQWPVRRPAGGVDAEFRRQAGQQRSALRLLVGRANHKHPVESPGRGHLGNRSGKDRLPGDLVGEPGGGTQRVSFRSTGS